MSSQVDDRPVLDTLAEMTADSLAHSTLEPRTLMMVRFAALAAVSAPPLSYLVNIEVGEEVGLTMEDAQAVLVAIAPIVGTAHVVAATGNVARALGIAIAAADEELSDGRSSDGGSR